MGIWSRYFFPWLMELTLARPEVSGLRKRQLEGAAGDILEIGLGTGLNIPHYPPGVKRIHSVDKNPAMSPLAARRADERGMELTHSVTRAEGLPFAAQSFDTVVSTFTLCSIPDLDGVIREIARVLRPGGKFLFLEHGLSPDPRVAAWQGLITPLWRITGDGCHLDRCIRERVEGDGLVIDSLDEFEFEPWPRIAGYIYMGVARRR